MKSSRSQEVTGIEGGHEFPAASAYKARSPGRIQQVPAAVEIHGIPGMIGSKIPIGPILVIPRITGHHHGADTRIPAERVKEARIAFANRFAPAKHNKCGPFVGRQCVPGLIGRRWLRAVPADLIADVRRDPAEKHKDLFPLGIHPGRQQADQAVGSRRVGAQGPELKGRRNLSLQRSHGQEPEEQEQGDAEKKGHAGKVRKSACNIW